MCKIQKYCWPLLFLLTVGCATTPNWLKSSWLDRSRVKQFKLTITSEPVGADVLWKSDSGTRTGGTTPGDLSFSFIKKRSDTLLGDLGVRSWVPKVSANQPWQVREEEEAYVFTIPQLYLKKDGFKPEPFSYEWRIPKGFKLPDDMGRDIIPVPTKQQAHVVLRTPTKPQLMRNITVDCVTGPAKIYAKTKSGEMGELIGETPFKESIGFGAERAASGKIVNWHHWAKKNPELWTVSKEGVLRLNGFMVGEGFLPQDLAEHPIMMVEIVQPTSHQAAIQLTRPANPEATFTLEMDSLPSDASIYVLRVDGSLGGMVGRTPLKLDVGLAQELQMNDLGEYVHKDWLIWDPSGTVQWKPNPDGSTIFYLSCALYRDGFAPENVTKPIFQMTPGRPYPTRMVLTVPLYKPEHAAMREAKNQPPIIIPAPAPQPAGPQPRPSVIWKEPAESQPQKSVSPSEKSYPSR